MRYTTVNTSFNNRFSISIFQINDNLQLFQNTIHYNPYNTNQLPSVFIPIYESIQRLQFLHNSIRWFDNQQFTNVHSFSHHPDVSTIPTHFNKTIVDGNSYEENDVQCLSSTVDLFDICSPEVRKLNLFGVEVRQLQSSLEIKSNCNSHLEGRYLYLSEPLNNESIDWNENLKNEWQNQLLINDESIVQDEMNNNELKNIANQNLGNNDFVTKQMIWLQYEFNKNSFNILEMFELRWLKPLRQAEIECHQQICNKLLYCSSQEVQRPLSHSIDISAPFFILLEVIRNVSFIIVLYI